MSNNKFKYPIDPKKIYTLEYDDLSGEIAGEEILATFRRQLYLDKILLEAGWQDVNWKEEV